MPPLITLKESELEESFDRSSGPGGQNVNKTSTKVTLRHLPTGVSVTIQDTRSQAQNRQLARERLLELLLKRAQDAAAHRRDQIEKARRQKRKRPPRVKAGILENKRKRGQVKKERSARNFD
ncbi:MAG TPA: peptide chain release factor-like protein [Verrucomicrobiae bacterium]|nr:peptide chain release factor-like protein [Verrucomicrobiae bacterium]